MTKTPRVAIVSFPGTNGEVESMRAIRAAGMEPVFFRWNENPETLRQMDAYFIPGGFSYEDRGRSGMVSARDPIMDVIREEAAKGKVVIGICNGAQVLIESGLVPNGEGLQMCLARNAIQTKGGVKGLPLLSEWVHITPSCKKGRCATAYWEGIMHIPISHGEGRFTTSDPHILKKLQENDQIAFSYCDPDGKISEDPSVTPNGAMLAMAGVCNPEGNVIALMPHPERAPENGAPYFASMKQWITERGLTPAKERVVADSKESIPAHKTSLTEIFIDTLIVNNEERTVEQAARRIAPQLKLKQWKYLAVPEASVPTVLADLTIYNANKERATIRRGNTLTRWNAAAKREEQASVFSQKTLLLRRDMPDTGASAWGKGSETGVAYGMQGITEEELMHSRLLEVFCNKNSSTLERL